MDPLDAFDPSLRVEIRDLVPADLPGPPGWLSHTYVAFWDKERTRADAGEVRLLVAVARDQIVGRLAVDLARKRSTGIGILWAFDVIPPLQGIGIGRRMVAVAETIVRGGGLQTVEIASYKDNDPVTRWYERLGYTIVGEEIDDWTEVRPDGTVIRHDEPCWTMQKAIDRV